MKRIIYQMNIIRLTLFSLNLFWHYEHSGNTEIRVVDCVPRSRSLLTQTFDGNILKLDNGIQGTDDGAALVFCSVGWGLRSSPNARLLLGGGHHDPFFQI